MTPLGAIHTRRPAPRISSRGAGGLIALVTAALFADATFYAVIAPLLPHYRDALGLGHLEIALLFAAHPAGTVVAALPAARLVDSRGPATVMTAGLLALGVAAIVFGVTDSYPVLVACRVVEGASAALVWCAGLARLQDAAPAERRGAALGLAGAAAGAGSLAGPGFAALSSLIGIEATLIGLGALGFGLAFALRLAGELPRERQERASSAPVRSLLADELPRERGGRAATAPLSSLLGPDVVRPAGVILICGAVLGAVSTIGPLRLADLGAGVVLIAGAFVGSAVGEVVISPAAGHLSDRVGRTAPIRIALVLAVPLLFVVGFAGSIPMAALAIALNGSLVAVLWPLGTALLSDRAGRLGRSAAEVSAVSIVAWSLGLGGGSVLCGALSGAFGNGVGIAFLALPCLLGLALLGGGETGDEACLPRLDPQTVNSVN